MSMKEEGKPDDNKTDQSVVEINWSMFEVVEVLGNGAFG